MGHDVSAQERYEWCVLCDWTDGLGVHHIKPYAGESLFPRGTSESDVQSSVRAYVIDRLRATASAKITWRELRWDMT